MNYLMTSSGAWDRATRTRESIARFVVLTALIMTGRGLLASADVGGLMGGGGPPSPAPCITDLERLQIHRAIAEWESRRPESTHSAALGVPQKFTFYPLGGTLYRDLFTNNFVDLDPSPGVLDWDCTGLTYNGHDASDVDLRGFGEQSIGVPVFAALDGTVVDAHDGEPDMQTSCSGNANYAIIQHAGGRYTYYWHMKRNSVLVSVSQIVRAGEQLGLAASSGCSTQPHLHFATYDNSVLVEPYAGPCRPDESEWVNQTPVNRLLYLRDLNITTGTPNPPFDRPRTGTFVTGLRDIRFWIMTGNFPAESTYQHRFRRPDSSVAFDSGPGGLGNPFYRSSWWWWSWFIDLDQLGTWHLEVELNGTLVASAPFDVVSTAGQIVNRPPNPITVQIEPSAPTENDVLICRVNTDLILDDPDYDIVRYHYVWNVDGLVVRDIVSAGQADAIPHHTGSPGSQVRCTVTPSDGVADGPTVSVTANLSCPGLCGPLQDPTGEKTRAISFFVPPSSSATATPGQTAIRVSMIDLQNPVPPNLPQFPPPDFSGFEVGTCADPGGCARWVGKPGTFLEFQDSPGLGSFRGARLQCSPYYHDWGGEGLFHVSGGEIVPSSIYEVEVFAAICKGNEDICAAVSAPATMYTRRSGDVEAPFQAPPPAALSQPNAIDIAQVVTKVKNLVSALPKSFAQLQPNLPELNADVNALDIVAVVDAVKQKAYAFGGPCPCPSTVTCGPAPGSVACTTATVCVSTFGAAAMCVKTCTGGDNDGDPCINDTHCAGNGICGNGFCRDRCGRCTP